MPSRSSSLMSDASVKRAGGVVSWRFGIRAEQRDRRAAVGMNAIADLGLRQDRFLLFELRGGIVAAFDVGAAEAGELDRLAARGHRGDLAVRALRRDLHRRAQHARVDHLRRHRPLPDQLVDLELVGVEHAFELTRREPEVGRADRFVRFLRVLHARLVAARPVVVLGAEHLADHARRFLHRLVRQRGRVGAVIGDEAFHLAVARSRRPGTAAAPPASCARWRTRACGWLPASASTS